MTLHVPRLPFSLDPLMAEARRRMRRRRFLAVIAIAVAVGIAVGLTLALRSPAGSSPSAASLPSHAGFASIPGLTKIASSAWTTSLCADLKGSGIRSAQRQAPWYCAQRALYRQQVWALTAAVRKYGIHRVPQPIPLTLARQHPGPDGVVVDVLTLASPSVARRFFPIETQTSGYTALPSAAINGGIAARIDSLANGGLGEFRFAWVNGPSLVEINILGAAMTANEAKHIALLARPS